MHPANRIKILEEGLFDIRNRIGVLKGQSAANGDNQLEQWCQHALNDIKKVLHAQ